MSNENFADKWKEQPEKATAFFEWLQNAYIDFTNLDEYKKFSDVERIFKDLFSQKPVERLMKKYEISLIREKREVSVLSNQSPSIIALERLPHRKTPPWVLPRNFRVGIQGKISYDNGITYQHFSSGTILPKGASLEFYPIHTIPSPYKIKWQVTNTGEEAREANSLRGDEFENPNLIKNGFLCGKKEVTSYTGTHYVQCFIIKNGNQCVGLSKPFIVKIK